jgi:hypothetical protein
VDITQDCRLVLEALYLQRLDTCVVRVYEEFPPKIIFARKFSLSDSSCTDLLGMAADAFGQSLPANLPAQRRVPTSPGLGVAQSMLPIPPPVSIADIPTAIAK